MRFHCTRALHRHHRSSRASDTYRGSLRAGLLLTIPFEWCRPSRGGSGKTAVRVFRSSMWDSKPAPALVLLDTRRIWGERNDRDGSARVRPMPSASPGLTAPGRAGWPGQVAAGSRRPVARLRPVTCERYRRLRGEGVTSCTQTLPTNPLAPRYEWVDPRLATPALRDGMRRCDGFLPRSAGSHASMRCGDRRDG